MEFDDVIIQHNLFSARKGIVLWASELKEKTLLTEREHACLLTLENGDLKDEIIIGDHSQINIRKHLNYIQSHPNLYVHMHSHPDNSIFSPEDMTSLFNVKDLRTIIVIGTKDLFIMSKKDNSAAVSIDKIKEILKQKRDGLIKLYTWNNRELLLDEILNLAAIELGAIYHRIKGGIK
ncbi:hypothetical protein [Bacillus sp. EB01]|uniref:hypothetical protein n=1 Tax=Bacillus sp. EB01 TaxID=1347086 RepID=UPI0005C73D53|nr:hypothetical protein [Bacillus sp. EB01]